jgi:putative DNA primase/helicase
VNEPLPDTGVPIEEAPDNALPDDASVTFAAEFLDRLARDEQGRLLLRAWKGSFYRFNGSCFRRQQVEQIEAEIYRFLKSVKVRVNRGSRWAPKWRTAVYQPEPRKVSDVTKTLAHESIVPSPVDRMPAWLNDAGAAAPDPADIICFQNGLLDIRQLRNDEGLAALLPNTPDWFSETCLPFDFDPDATCPAWEEFLDSALQEDAERKSALREWFGYCLVASRKYQKMLMLVGPPASGKSTTLRVLERCVGNENCGAVNLNAMASHFGLEGLIGKSVCIIPDAHLDRHSDTASILDRLLGIVGGDKQQVQRKYQTSMELTLNVKFSMAVNRLPQLPDASNAIVRRLLIIPFNVSFEGREDHDLDRQLEAETPGIVLWALRGLLNLEDMGGFTEPRAAKPILAQLRRLNSPIEAFVRDRCELGRDFDMSVKDLFDACNAWRKRHGHRETTSNAMGADLNALGLPIERKRFTDDAGVRYWGYAGIKLRPPGEDCSEGDDDDEAGRLF